MKDDKYIEIKYKIDLINKDKAFNFTVQLDKKNITAIPPEESTEREWTNLGFYQCSICPFDTKKVKNCPIAYNISALAESFADITSIEEADITVKVKERTYKKKDVVQEGLKSIIGIYMATSGCPHMEILKPMARFHLPFATMEETIFRHVGNYFISAYYNFLENKESNIDIQEFKRKYDLINKVNLGIFKRIQNISEGDASKNALVTLNAFGQMVGMELDYDLESIKYLFKNSKQ